MVQRAEPARKGHTQWSPDSIPDARAQVLARGGIIDRSPSSKAHASLSRWRMLTGQRAGRNHRLRPWRKAQASLSRWRMLTEQRAGEESSTAAMEEGSG